MECWPPETASCVVLTMARKVRAADRSSGQKHGSGPRYASPFPERLNRLDPTPLLGRDINRRSGQRRMPQVLLRDLHGHAPGNRMARVRVPHPVGAGCRFPFKLSLPLFHAVTDPLSGSHVSRVPEEERTLT